MRRESEKKLKLPRLLWRRLKDKHSLPEKNKRGKSSWLKRQKKKPREQGLLSKRPKKLVLLLRRKKDLSKRRQSRWL